MDGNAIILTGDLLDSDFAKTAHGLIRGTERYNILGIIDAKLAGHDGGELTDGKHRGIPVFDSLTLLKNEIKQEINYAIVGVATPGGVIPPILMANVKEAIANGCSIISGLHTYLNDNPEVVALAKKHGVELLDIRKPKPVSELKFWTGKIKTIKTPIVAVLGTDCALGKRTTARFLRDAMRQKGISSEMIFTGQTGWLQGGKYGFVFDATLNDFVSGELEHAILECHDEANPDIIFLEGQAALLNPSGPCGSEFIISGNAKGVILQHSPIREHYKGWKEFDLKIPSIKKNIELIKLYGASVLAISLNTRDIDLVTAEKHKKEYEETLGLPVILPVEEGVGALIPVLEKYIGDYQ